MTGFPFGGAAVVHRALLALFSLCIAGLAAAQPSGASPDLAPQRHILAHVDIETTGLDPARHERPRVESAPSMTGCAATVR